MFGHDVPMAILGVAVATGIGAAALVVSEKKEVKRIVMNLQPQPLSPDRPSVLSGRFEDEKGKPVKVKMGRYLLLSKQGPKPQVVGGGLIGPWTSEFNVTIDTRGLPAGKIDVIVEDTLPGLKQ